MIPLAIFALGACLAVGARSDRILAGDLAAAAPEWSAVAPETQLALAPAPGGQRVFHPLELRRLAQRWNLPAVPDRELCVTRPVAVPDPAVLLAAMRRQLPGARIEILEFSRQPAPQGDLEFPLSGLRPPSTDGSFWSGYVTYGGHMRFAVWARVKVAATVSRVVSGEDLKPGRAVDGAILRVESREEFPVPGFVASVGEAAGRVARRSIAAGAPLRAEWLEPAKVIARGDAVQVEIVAGAARLTLAGIAASSGAVGDTILVVNPDSKRQFRARVQSQGKVLVTRGDS
jgi:flagella basal body P-ring formation protein FlgA